MDRCQKILGFLQNYVTIFYGDSVNPLHAFRNEWQNS